MSSACFAEFFRRQGWNRYQGFTRIRWSLQRAIFFPLNSGPLIAFASQRNSLEKFDRDLVVDRFRDDCHFSIKAISIGPNPQRIRYYVVWSWCVIA